MDTVVQQNKAVPLSAKISTYLDRVLKAAAGVGEKATVQAREFSKTLNDTLLPISKSIGATSKAIKDAAIIGSAVADSDFLTDVYTKSSNIEKKSTDVGKVITKSKKDADEYKSLTEKELRQRLEKKGLDNLKRRKIEKELKLRRQANSQSKGRTNTKSNKGKSKYTRRY